MDFEIRFDYIVNARGGKSFFINAKMSPKKLCQFVALSLVFLFLMSNDVNAKGSTKIKIRKKATAAVKNVSPQTRLKALKEAYEQIENGPHTRNTVRKAVDKYEKNLEAKSLEKKAYLFYLIDSSRAYLRLGDLTPAEDKRLVFYQKGRIAAQKAQGLDRGSADALFWDMANLASIGRVRGIAVTVVQLPELFDGLKRAISLEPKHFYAREVLARLYHEVPGIMGGSDEKAIALLQQCIKDDVHFTPCKVTLGKLYQDIGETQKARRLLNEVVNAKTSSVPADFRKFNRAEAEAALKSLP